MGARYEKFLLAQGISADDAAQQSGNLALFMAQHMPDVGVLEAVRELRVVVQGRTERMEQKGRFSSLVKAGGADPIAYALEHYGDEIRSGRMPPQELFRVDKVLYAGLTYTLKRQEPPQTIAEFFAGLRADDKPQDRVGRRSRACAQILGTNEVQAAKFLGSISTAVLQREKSQQRQASRA